VVGGLSLGLVAAGLASPTVGRAIQDYGGRAVLAISSILLAVGLIGVGLSQNIATYLAGWIVIGFGMGSRTLRSCICDARTDLSREGQKLDHHAHLVWRIFEHDLLAAQLVARPNNGVAVHLFNLCGSTACNEFANLLAALALCC
jgi:hypothetical protein